MQHFITDGRYFWQGSSGLVIGLQIHQKPAEVGTIGWYKNGDQ